MKTHVKVDEELIQATRKDVNHDLDIWLVVKTLNFGWKTVQHLAGYIYLPADTLASETIERKEEKGVMAYTKDLRVTLPSSRGEEVAD